MRNLTDTTSFGRGKEVIVITGHADENLAAFVRQLGDAGYFEGNFVVFNSCQTPLSEQLIAEITTRFGGTAAFQLEGIIPDGSLEQAIFSYFDSVQKAGRSKLRSLLIDALHRSKLNGAWSVSELLPRDRGTTSSTMDAFLFDNDVEG